MSPFRGEQGVAKALVAKRPLVPFTEERCSEPLLRAVKGLCSAGVLSAGSGGFLSGSRNADGA